MNEYSFSDITKAIAKRVRELYPGYPVYLEYPEQNLNPPCFVLRTSGGNIRRRIRNGKALRGLSYERFTLEFYSLDIAEIQEVSFELRVYLDVVEGDNGNLYRCYNKNSMMALTENHVSLTFRVLTEPYVEGDELPRMESLDFSERLTGGR